MRIFIFGASGLAGKCIKKVLDKNGFNVFGTYRTENEFYEKDASMYRFSLGDRDRFFEILKEVDPDVVISCLTGDFSEQFKAHERMAEYLAGKENGKMIFISTANVFDAESGQRCPHTEEDAPEAESDYGKYKMQCEQMLTQRLGDRAVILRPPEIWGKDCPRLQNLLNAVSRGETIPVYGNLFLNYTTDIQIAEWTAYIIQKDLRGIFHVGTRDMMEFFAFRRTILEGLKVEGAVFDVEEVPGYVQAVLPGRKEIPDSMQRDVMDVISYVAGTGTGEKF